MLGMLQAVVPLILGCFLSVSGLATVDIYENDAIIIKTNLNNERIQGFSYGGFFFINYDDETVISFFDEQTNREIYNWFLSHEYGHLLQQRKYGYRYFAYVAIPSLISTMFIRDDSQLFWEAEANFLTGHDPTKKFSRTK